MITNSLPIIVILVLIMLIIVSKHIYLSMTLLLILGIIYYCNSKNIIHSRQIINFLESIYYKITNEISVLDIKRKIENFSNDLISDKQPILDKKNIDIPIDILYKDIPILSKYESLQNNLNSFIDNIKDKTIHGILDRNRMKNEINNKIANIFLNAYMVVQEEYYPDNNYYSCIDSQKSLLNEIHNFIYLDLDPLYDDEMNQLIDTTIKLNDELNNFLISNIKDKKNFNGIIPNSEEPRACNLKDLCNIGTSDSDNFNINNNNFF